MPTPFVSVLTNLSSIERKSRLMEIFSKKCNEQILAMSAWEVIIAKLPLKLSNTLPKEYISLHRAVNGKETLISESSFNTRREEKPENFSSLLLGLPTATHSMLAAENYCSYRRSSNTCYQVQNSNIPVPIQQLLFDLFSGQPTKIITISFTFTPAAILCNHP